MFGTLSPAAASVPLQINFVILVVVLRRICGIKGRVEKMKTKARVRSVDAVGLSVCLFTCVSWRRFNVKFIVGASIHSIIIIVIFIRLKTQ